MNHDKARDFFSSYYEGSLEGGLKQSFELKLSTDASLQGDYAAFVETIRELDTLRFEEIAIPVFLSDRIATRLEQVQEKPKFGFPVWSNWLRGFAVTGLAAAAIVFALPFFNSNKGASTADLVASGSNLDQIRFKVDGSKLVLQYQPSNPKTLVISSPTTGKEIQRFDLNSQRVESPIENSLANPAIFKIQPIGDKNSSLVAVPGQSPSKAKTGEGSVQDLSLALAGHYRIPVVIEAADVTHRVSWNFSTSDVRVAANQAVANEGFSVDQRPDGLVVILDR